MKIDDNTFWLLENSEGTFSFNSKSEAIEKVRELYDEVEEILQDMSDDSLVLLEFDKENEWGITQHSSMSVANEVMQLNE